MLQLDLFADFLETAWESATIDVAKIENHPNMNSYQLIAYQELLHWSGNGEVQGYCLISQTQGKNPYHYGSASIGLEGYGVCPNAIEQQFMLTHPGRWRLQTSGAGSIQWTPWKWKNKNAEQQFMRWHTDRFATWTEDDWQKAKRKGNQWRPVKEEKL